MVIGLLGAVRDPFRSPAPELAALLSPATRLRPFPSRVPAFPFTPLEQALQQVGHLEAGLTAAAAGCDALVIDSLGDYGLAALRAATALPVFGPGEVGMAAAAAGGRRFGIVTVWPASMNFIPEGLLRTYGHEAACIGIANVGAEAELDRLAGPDGYLAQVRDGAAAVLDAIAAAIADMAGRGAAAVLLGCTCMSPLAAALAARAPVPVINPLASAVLAAERAGGWAGGERMIARPGRPDLVKRMVQGVADEPAEDCPVCIVASSLGE
jgi:allantoin racemase